MNLTTIVKVGTYTVQAVSAVIAGLIIKKAAASAAFLGCTSLVGKIAAGAIVAIPAVMSFWMVLVIVAAFFFGKKAIDMAKDAQLAQFSAAAAEYECQNSACAAAAQ